MSSFGFGRKRKSVDWFIHHLSDLSSLGNSSCNLLAFAISYKDLHLKPQQTSMMTKIRHIYTED